jgi:hypothetical protein
MLIEERKYTESEKQLRDAFVEEYLTDFDAFNACIRIGFNPSNSVIYSKSLMEESYVQKQISLKERRRQKSDEDQTTEDKELVLSVLRKAAQNGPFATRVAAAAKLATILGLDKPAPVDTNDINIEQIFKEFSQKVT